MRNIFTVNATQVVTSEANPQGLYSVVSGYPKNFDSNSYADTDAALRAAKAEYYDRLSKIYTGSPNRVMATVTLMQADGRLIQHECVGGFPVEEEPVEPEVEPETVEY